VLGLGHRVTLDLLDVLTVNRCERVLSACNASRRPLDVVASDGEKSCRIVQFDAPTTVPALREFTSDEDVIAGAGRRHFRIGIESLDDVEGCVVDVVCLGVTAVV
jgi:hypothetical protein